jgi:hypothetical protein
MARRKTIQVRDLFVEPNFNELEAVALDSKAAIEHSSSFFRNFSNVHCIVYSIYELRTIYGMLY